MSDADHSDTAKTRASHRVELKKILLDIAKGHYSVENRLDATRQLVDLMTSEQPKTRKKRNDGRKAVKSMLGID